MSKGHSLPAPTVSAATVSGLSRILTMSATDVLDAYLDQHCKRTFQSSKSVLRGRPPRHGGRSKSTTSSFKHCPASEPLSRAAQPASPASKIAKSFQNRAHADLLRGNTAAADKSPKLAAMSSRPDKVAKRTSSLPLLGSHKGHQTPQKPSISPQHDEHSTVRGQKASLEHTHSSPVIHGELFPTNGLKSPA